MLIVDEVGCLSYVPDAADVLYHVVRHRHRCASGENHDAMYFIAVVLGEQV